MNFRIPDAALGSIDRMEPPDSSLEDWTPIERHMVTDEEVVQFISDIADSGVYDDMLGRKVTATNLYLTLAIEYRYGTLPSAVSVSFFNWAKSAAQIAMFGKPIAIAPRVILDDVPTSLQEQAGLRISKPSH